MCIGGGNGFGQRPISTVFATSLRRWNSKNQNRSRFRGTQISLRIVSVSLGVATMFLPRMREVVDDAGRPLPSLRRPVRQRSMPVMGWKRCYLVLCSSGGYLFFCESRDPGLYWVCTSSLFLLALVMEIEVVYVNTRRRRAHTDAIAKASIGILICLGAVFWTRH
jgi:hypothetical protein